MASRNSSVPLTDDSRLSAPDTPALAILGPDVVVAAAPATQAQLIGACTRLGFDAVVPAAWGDELIAEATLRHLGARGSESVVLCACPSAYAVAAADHRLSRHLLALVSPGVAAARYLRMLYAPARVRITYLGQCAGVTDRDVEDVRSASWVLDALASAGIDPTIMPDDYGPGHRRYRSIPGGAPHPDHLRRAVRHELITLAGDDAPELAAAHIAHGRIALIDLAEATRCGCGGGALWSDGRARTLLEELEPPRAMGEVLSPTIRPDLTLGAVRVAAEIRPPLMPSTGEREVQLPTVGLAAAQSETRSSPPRRRPRTSGMMRAIGALAPAMRSTEGRSLPRAYLGHRTRHGEGVRLTPTEETKGERVVALASARLADAPPSRRSSGSELVVRLPDVEPYRVPPPPTRATSIQRLTLFALAIAALITVLVAFIN
jgi:hypothetical protein